LTGSSRTELRDGSTVVIRPLSPDDRELLRAGFERLSERSRYLRFQTPLTELSDQQLSHLTAVDHHDHEALLALDPESDDAIGVARFVRVGDNVAECAIVVADDWQNRGLGGALLERLVQRAHEEGVERFTALVLAENTDALRLLGRLGDTVRHSQGSQLELEIELPERVETSAPLRLLLAGAARGLVVPAISMWRQVADFAHHRRRADGVAEPANVIVAHAYDPGDGGGAPALAVAAGLAAARQAHVHLVVTYWPMVTDRAEADERLSVATDELRRQGVGVTPHLLGGDTVDAVIDIAEETDAALIVIDPRAASAVTPWRPYSLPARVCARAPCDVLIARDVAAA
jgi:RimJ/RimL family protein N-acetyltransferase/nucleotide-binding universal stress UspA family protein